MQYNSFCVLFVTLITSFLCVCLIIVRPTQFLSDLSRVASLIALVATAIAPLATATSIAPVATAIAPRRPRHTAGTCQSWRR